ncbi:dTDP-4-dehydrorhamnose 3,5-epimerase family protein [Marinitenerispora sediminis]|uniref:dTDP-4-dehydrorhamnose 3,5-epimerase n=1 Tax=Marinitenerispora sediminis TaxID=1931232 RepID=A0A368T0N2_9ACTN|nr:dTDP-4-dehydrorhamnose 3,5-epimerase family protein [Marinitenerispora sediminis]RCV50837.1 dTDP-4-dehydrorhamnose 3,5-epimerase [Marinitenerispora sediminis]RCV52885.1 dTDP-4-dehydrorhamnose 3,5-epimerase [Marinitenerispora sediminis]
MRVRRLGVEGALEFTPEVFRDDRGAFTSPLQRHAFARAAGRPPFPVAQTSHSRSRRGTVRGVHYTRTPPGTAKYVCCLAGRALDLVIDLREGSPTFGRCEAVPLDGEGSRALYLPVGVGHAFVALEDGTLMSYLMSAEYAPEHELAVRPLDPALGLPLPDGLDPLLSDRDCGAPTLAEARERGLLPEYDTCRTIEESL